MSIARLLLDVDPRLASTLRGVNHETQFPVLHVVKRKWNCFLFSAVTYLIFEMRIVDSLIQVIPDLTNVPLISWLFSRELSSVPPRSLAVVASSRPFLEQTPEEPVAYLDADKVMQFPKEEQKRLYEDAMIEYTKLKELYVAQERARFLTELVHLVQWCWEAGTFSAVCYYSPEELTGIEEAIEAAMEQSEKGILSVVTSQSKRELVVGRGTKEGGVGVMTIYIATKTHMPFHQSFEMIIATSEENPMVTLQSFVCQGTPFITPTARTFSRASFNEALRHYHCNQSK